jgi:hypothetical protein
MPAALDVYGYRFEAERKVVAINGNTVDCEGLAQTAHGAELLLHCCCMASAEIENEHFPQVAQHTPAAGDTIGNKIAARAILAEEVARDLTGRVMWARTSPRSNSKATGRRAAQPSANAGDIWTSAPQTPRL